MADANKIKYGLSNVYYAVATISATNNTATYSAPVAFPGAVSISLDAEGDTSTFYADNIAYYVSASNNGYSGSLEMARITDDFAADILGEVTSTSGLTYEVQDMEPVHFALMFQFAGDAKATRHVIYNCVATRPSISGSTKEESIEPQTETVDLTATSIYVASISKNVVKGKVLDGATAYSSFFTAVVQPS